MDKPILSICIPTYNRAEYLDKCIESIVKQKEFLDDNIELVILDNASSDNTTEIVNKYKKKYKNIYYYKNDKNIVDLNFIKVITRSNGIYKKIINDSLIFKENSLKYIISIIKDNIDNRPYLFWKNNKKGEKIKIGDTIDFIKQENYWMTSILTFGLWEDDCVNLLNNTYDITKKLWQQYKALECVDKKNKYIQINEKLFDMQIVKNKDISYSLYEVFYVNNFENLSQYFEKYKFNKEEISDLKKSLLFDFFMNFCIDIFNKKSNFLYGKEDLYRKLRSEFHDKNYWIIFAIKYHLKKIKIKIKNIILIILGVH